MLQFIDGGVCAAKGFQAAGIHAGVKTHAEWKKDVALILSDSECAAAAVFTKNKVKAAPILVDLAHLADGKARAILANSGNANACAPQGEENAKRMCEAAAKAIGCRVEDVLVSSTGVIGQTLNVEAIEAAVPGLYAALAATAEGSDGAAHAIMTTDTAKKETAVELTIGGKTVRIGGIAKGSGMIHPNMATMLCFITTDCAIAQPLLQKAVKAAADSTFNMVTVDGDTSTNDTFAVLANGAAGNAEIAEENGDYAAFAQGLEAVGRKLSKMLAGDGEGATKLLICRVSGAASLETARTCARSVIASDLTKAAMFGADANWGRVLCALGYSGADIDVDKIDVAFASPAGQVEVCRAGRGVDFSEELAAKVLSEKEVEILVSLHMGEESAEAYGCDLTYDYVKINGDYRT